MVNTEWSLLVEAEDITKGDMILVEDDDGRTEKLRYYGERKRAVILKDENGDVYMFDEESLEEKKGYRKIIGKAE